MHNKGGKEVDIIIKALELIKEIVVIATNVIALLIVLNKNKGKNKNKRSKK